MSLIFISHSEKDKDVMEEIARGLEDAGYSTWYFERDVFPGTSYLQQITKAIDSCDAVVLIASSHAIASDQTTKEVVGAFERGIPFFPVLIDLTPPELKERQPEWRYALGGTAMITVGPEGVVPIVNRIVEGLKERGVRPPGDVQKAEVMVKKRTQPVEVRSPGKKRLIIAASLGALGLIALALILLFAVFKVGSQPEEAIPSDTTEYRNAATGFSFRYPSSWEQIDEDNVDEIPGLENTDQMLEIYNEIWLVDELTASWEHMLSVQSLPPDVTGDSWNDFKAVALESEMQMISGYREQGIDAPDPDRTDVEVGGIEAMSVFSTFNIEGTQFASHNVYINDGDMFYAFGYTRRQYGGFADTSEFDAILESVVF